MNEKLVGQKGEYMNELQIFKNVEFGSMRIINVGDEIYFVGKDVADALGYVDGNKAVAMHVDDEDKKLNDKTSPSFGQRGATLINESGLYSLVLSSKLESARRFKRWITHEVIPSIRKYGSYNMAIPRTLPEALKAYANEIDEHNKTKALLEAQKPKVLFADAVSTSDTSILIGELAKILKQNGAENMGQNRLFEMLRRDVFLISRKGTDYNMPTQKSMELGLFKIKETAINHSDGHVSISKTPKVTGKGQQYFVDKYLWKN